MDTLTDADRLRHAALKSDRRRQEFAVSRALRFAALQLGPGSEPSTPSSLSHSGGWAAVAEAPAGCSVGVDLEFHRPRNILGVARFAFDPEEIAMIEALAPERRPLLFFTLWTLKESMAKALGLPLLTASRECVFSTSDVEGAADGEAVNWRARVPTDRPWLAQVFRPRPDMALSVAVFGSAAVDSVITREWPSPAKAAWHSVAVFRSASTASEGK